MYVIRTSRCNGVTRLLTLADASRLLETLEACPPGQARDMLLACRTIMTEYASFRLAEKREFASVNPDVPVPMAG